MTQSIPYLDLINKLAKEHKLKQTDLAIILKVNTRQYRRLVAKGLSFEQVMILLSRFDMGICAIKHEKERIIQYHLGQ